MTRLALVWVLCTVGAACDNPGDVTGGSRSSVLFQDELTELSRIDLGATTAELDAEAGVARTRARYAIHASAGTGVDGDLAPTQALSLAAGTHQLTSFRLDGITVTASGDLTLLVDGPIELTGGARLEVAGSLTLVASGPVSVKCSVIQGGARFQLDHLTDAELTLGCDQATGVVTEGTIRAAGAVELASRGSIHMSGRGLVVSEGGEVTVRTYGDIVASEDSGMRSGGGHAIVVETEGQLLLTERSFLLAGADGQDGTGLRLRVEEGVSLDRDSFLYTDAGGDIDVVTAGAFSLDGESYVVAADAGTRLPTIAITARGVTLEGVSHVQGGRPPPGLPAGELRIDSDGPILLAEASYIAGGAGPCHGGGPVLLRATGAVTVAGDSYIQGGNSEAGAGCSATVGGWLVIESASAIVGTTTGAAWAIPGTGTLDGSLTSVPGAAVSIEVDPGVVTWTSVVSRGLTIDPSGAALLGAGTTPAAGEHRRMLLAPVDGPFVDAPLASWQALERGWRWRVDLAVRMFDDVTLDLVEVRYTPTPGDRSPVPTTSRRRY